MKQYRSQRVILTIFILAFLLPTFEASVLRGADLKVMTFNVSRVGTFAENESIRIIQGMEPDIALLQEWALAEGTHREYVDEAFGPQFYYYLAYTNKDPVGNPWAMPNGIVSRWEMQTWGGWEYPSDPTKPYSAWGLIDLPGDDNLLAISVQLKAGDTTEDKEQRVEAAQLIKSYVEDFIASQQFSGYIAVAGSLNTTSKYEWCIQTFATFLEPTNHMPEDPDGNENITDWVMPNKLLDDFFVYAVVVTSAGPFMDHMAVMKVFDVLPAETPTPTPTVSPTPSQPTPEFFPASIDSGDYDGDGTSDIAIFRRSSGLWAIRGITRVYFGSGDDLPASGDFDGDGTTDIAIFRESTGLWAVRGVSRAYFGRTADIPVPGDYNGDGYCDIGIFRQDFGLWAIRGITRSYFGGPDDQPVPFNGAQPEKHIAIFRPGSGLWAIRGSTRIYFGTTGDTPIPANYQGLYAGATQLGIFRDADGLWAIRDTTRVYYGQTDDRPVPGNYQGTFKANITIFRESAGLWSIRGVTRLYFGTAGDLPVSGLAINPSSGVTP